MRNHEWSFYLAMGLICVVIIVLAMLMGVTGRAALAEGIQYDTRARYEVITRAVDSFDLAPLLTALIGILATIVTAYVVPWIRAQTNVEQRKVIRMIIEMLVKAAEQMFGSDWSGDEKRAWVLAQLKERGFDADEAEIEAVVYELGGIGRIMNRVSVTAADDGRPPGVTD